VDSDDEDEQMFVSLLEEENAAAAAERCHNFLCFVLYNEIVPKLG
jgi:hypothetical protein